MAKWLEESASFEHERIEDKYEGKLFVERAMSKIRKKKLVSQEISSYSGKEVE